MVNYKSRTERNISRPERRPSHVYESLNHSHFLLKNISSKKKWIMSKKEIGFATNLPLSTQLRTSDIMGESPYRHSLLEQKPNGSNKPSASSHGIACQVERPIESEGTNQ